MFKLYSLGKFQLYSIVLPTVVIMYYAGNSDSSHVTADNLYSFTKLFLCPADQVLTTTFLLFVSMDLTTFLKISDTMQCLPFSLWLISLSIMPSTSIHVVTNGRISLFLMAGQYSIVYLFHCGSHFFIRLSIDPHLGWFRSLVIVDNATTTMKEQIPLQDAVSQMCLLTAVVVGARIWWASISVSGGKARNGEDNPGEPGFFFFNWISWASLVLQWISIHLPVRETWVRSLIWDHPACHRAGEAAP